MINLKKYPINLHILTNEILVGFINKFWDDVFTNIKNNNHLMLMCKVQFSNTLEDVIGDEKTFDIGYRSLGHLRRVNFEDKDLFIEYLSDRVGVLNDSYHSQPILEIEFSYIIKEGLASDKDRALLQDQSNKPLAKHIFNNMNLPISMDPRDYGEVLILNNYIQDKEGQWIYRSIIESGTKTYKIDTSKDLMVNTVRIQGAIDLEWVDTRLSSDLEDSYTFKREIKKSTIYFMDGEVILRKQLLPAKPFRNSVKDSKIKNDFYTIDIETINQDGKLVPYLICAYDGLNYITSYGKDQKSLFKSFFDQLLSKIELGSSIQVYAHNLSAFDGIFMLRHLLPLGKVEPLLFKNKLMSIDVTIPFINESGLEDKSKVRKITFKDSYLLLPLSLRKLCIAFDISINKGHFPFLLSNIYYSGVFPKFEYWNIPLNEYEILKSEHKNKLWNFQLESIKYCKLDCLCLHELLCKFNSLIFNEFKVNIHKSLTLPALAMRIFKTHYMIKDTIYQLLGNPFYNISDSYTGGAVDMYIPHNRITPLFSNMIAKFKTLFSYDVNALYPTVMSKFDMPIGKPIAFEGNIRKVEPDSYGFFYCKITSPDNLKHPILQRRIKTSSGMRTVAGLGTWTGWISSIEMDNAIKFGYQFEILKGYQFEKGDLFSGYVSKLYELRLQYASGQPMNLIAKLLLNSLYGKFGMKLNTTEIVMYNCSTEEGKKRFKDGLDIWGKSIQDYIKIDDTYIIIRDSYMTVHYNEKEDMYHGQDINVAIASMITSCARVHMSVFKNNPLFNLYYSDTDSAVVDAQLPDFMVGTELGQMKLEHTINKAIFLAPKVYGLVNIDGNKIIKVKGITHSIKSVNISIQKSDRKVLIDNIYKPPVIYNGHIIKSMNTGVP